MTAIPPDPISDELILLLMFWISVGLTAAYIVLCFFFIGTGLPIPGILLLAAVINIAWGYVVARHLE